MHINWSVVTLQKAAQFSNSIHLEGYWPYASGGHSALNAIGTNGKSLGRMGLTQKRCRCVGGVCRLYVNTYYHIRAYRTSILLWYRCCPHHGPTRKTRDMKKVVHDIISNNRILVRYRTFSFIRHEDCYRSLGARQTKRW